jgi:hypothetical protein
MYFTGIERSHATGGRLVGDCSKLGCMTTRTDWCHDPAEIEKRSAAMAVYVVGGKRND